MMASFGMKAQEKVVIEGLSARGFSGVQSIGGKYYYTFYFGEKSQDKNMANFTLALYDADLKPLKTTSLEISKNSELAAASFSGKYFLFVFADVTKKTRTMFVLDREGNTVKTKIEEDVRRSLLVRENFPDVHIINEEEFLLVRAERDKKFGYEAERLDKDLNSKWVKSFFPDKGIWTVEDSHFMNGKLYLLRKEKPSTLTGDKYTYAVQALNAENGEIVYTTELKDEEDGGFPSFIRVAANGNVATGGMYFKNGKYDEKNSDGLFFTVVGADGSIVKTSKTPWKKVQDLVKGDFSSALVGGKTKVLVQDIVMKSDGSYVIITETFRKSNNANNTGGGTLRTLAGASSSSSATTGDESGFTVMDFALFRYDAAGELTGVDRIEKTNREAVIRGERSNDKGLELAQWLHTKKKFFTYRGVITHNGKQYIMYKNDDGMKSKAYFLPLDATSANGIGEIDMDKWVSEGVNKLGRFSKVVGGNKYTFESTEEFGAPSSPELYKNIIPAKPGYVLLYQFSNGKMTIWLEPIPAS